MGQSDGQVCAVRGRGVPLQQFVQGAQVSLYDISRGYFAGSIDCIVQVNGIAGVPAARPVTRAHAHPQTAFKSSAAGGVAACADGGRTLRCRRLLPLTRVGFRYTPPLS